MNVFFKLIFVCVFFITTIANSQTYTTVQDGPWTSASTWSGGSPPTDLSNITINIDHRVTYTGTIKVKQNSTININYILRFYGGSLEMEEETSVVNIDYGLLVVPNGLFLNKKGIVNLNYGRIQLCNSSYKDESSSPNGTFGIGDIYADNGSIENTNPGNFSSGIEWCITGGSPLNLPNSENCSAVAPPAGFVCTDELLYEPAKVDFDGVDDYLDSETDLVGLQNATIMAWAQLSDSFSNQGYIVGQPNFNILVNDSEELVVTVNGASIKIESVTIDTDIWTHVAAIYEASHATEKLRVYINGVKVGSLNTGGTIGSLLQNTNKKFTIGRKPGVSSNYFKGAIDEVRVFDIALTDSQLGQIVYQEIEKDGNNVKGVILSKEIKDFDTDNTISWSNLIAYYPMTRGISGLTYAATLDHSEYKNRAIIYNITTRELQTAPMPYETISDGFASDEDTWLHGDYWNLEALVETEFPIVKISHNVTLDDDLKTLGLIIDLGKTLTADGTYQVNNSWYLELNGIIDLKNDSQLIQGIQSDLVTSVEGKILRRQEGNSSMYWYNYWSSPVGSQAAISYTDNNTSTNNPNNTAFNHDMLKDGTGNAIGYVSAHEEVGKVSLAWLYTFVNGSNYYDWNALTIGEAIAPGVGYSQKGMGLGTEQQYIFEGKPNNGTIKIDAVDTGVGTVSTYSVLGNPYASAIDARKFITDNTSVTNNVIDGTILLWEQWAGSTHAAAYYQGGYAYVNKMTTVAAAQYPYSTESGSQPGGTKRPSFYIPVGQGFFVEVINDGEIEFNNGQRVFVKESDGSNANPYLGSTFLRSSNSSEPEPEEATSPYQMLRLALEMSDTSSRTMVLGFDESFTDAGREHGFDGGLIQTPLVNDLGSLLNGDQYVIQALSPITADKVVDLTFTATGTENYTIKNIEITNIEDTQALYLRDNLLNVYFDLRNEAGYNFTSEAGTFTDRFDVVFTSGETLSNDEFDTADNTTMFFNNAQEILYVKGLQDDVKQLHVYNALGQVILTKQNMSSSVLESGITISNLSTGLYIVSIKTENNITIDKKIIIE